MSKLDVKEDIEVLKLIINEFTKLISSPYFLCPSQKNERYLYIGACDCIADLFTVKILKDTDIYNIKFEFKSILNKVKYNEHLYNKFNIYTTEILISLLKLLERFEYYEACHNVKRFIEELKIK